MLSSFFYINTDPTPLRRRAQISLKCVIISLWEERVINDFPGFLNTYNKELQRTIANLAQLAECPFFLFHSTLPQIDEQ